MEKIEKRIKFLQTWIEDLQDKKDFESQNMVFTLEQELSSRKMYLQTMKRDATIKKMDIELPQMIDNIDREKLPLELREKYKGLVKRVKANGYVNVYDKISDYELAQSMLIK